MSITNKPLYFDLIDACQQPGCPVCTLAQKSVAHYLNSLFYEEVNDIGVREELRKSLGFCHEHAWLATNLGVGDALGLAMIYRDVFSTVLKDLPAAHKEEAAHRKSSLRLSRIRGDLAERIASIEYHLAPRDLCLACKHRDRYTADVLSILVESLQEDAMWRALLSSNGLCLLHLGEAFQKVKRMEEYEFLLSLAHQELTRINGELEEFIRKNDYRFLPEGFGPEGDSWKRSVILAVGNDTCKR